MATTNSRVLSGWNQGKCPILNAVFYPDDTVVPLDVTEHEDGTPPEVRPRKSVPLAAAYGAQRLEWTSLGILVEAPVPELDARAVAGQGGLGGDGFVALTKGAENRLKWLVFFDCSNPFEGVRIEGGNIIAISNLGVEWHFPLAHPEKVTVRSPGP